MTLGEEWQTPALFIGLALLVGVLFWRWHSSPLYKKFCLLHAVANREGYYDPDRAHLTGAFLVCTFAVVVSVIRNAVTADVALLIGGYASVFALKAGWNYTVNRRTDADVRTAEIRRGRFEDVPPDADIDDPNAISVEEKEETRPKPRRRRTDSVFK